MSNVINFGLPQKLSEKYANIELEDWLEEDLLDLLYHANVLERIILGRCCPPPQPNLLNNDESLGIHPTARCIRCGGAMEILDMRCANECEGE
jgi:hypothetical protein